jgi:hypothetical protein
MASGQQPSPLAEEEIRAEGSSRQRLSEAGPGQRTDSNGARSRDPARTALDATSLGIDARSRSPVRDPVRYTTTQADAAKWDRTRDPSPGSSISSSGSSRPTPRSPIAMIISSSGRASSSPSPTLQSSPTRRSRTSPVSAVTAPMLGRSQSYITTPTNQMTSSALASGHGHMMAGASEPSDIRRPRSNSHSGPAEDIRPTSFTRPSLGGRAASSAAAMTYRSAPASIAVTESQRSDPSSPPLANMPVQQYSSEDKAPSFSPESDRDSGEMSPDADDEASPVHSPSPTVESLSLSPTGEETGAAESKGNMEDHESMETSTLGFGLPKAQAGANVSFPGVGTGLETGYEGTTVGGAEVDPDVEGIPEALSMPRDLMPSEDAFEDEGLTTLERIFLLSRSEHAFHRYAY